MSNFFDRIDTSWKSQIDAGAKPDQFMLYALKSVGVKTESDIPKLGSLKALAREFYSSNNDTESLQDTYENLTLWEGSAREILLGTIPYKPLNSMTEMFGYLQSQGGTTNVFGESLPANWKQQCGMPAALTDAPSCIGYNEKGELGQYPINISLQFNPEEIEQCLIFANRQDILRFLAATQNKAVQRKLNKLLLFSTNDNICIVGLLNDSLNKKSVRVTVGADILQISLSSFVLSLGDINAMPPSEKETVVAILNKLEAITDLAATRNLKDPVTGLPVSLILV